jgi:thiamine monophosphate synthase
LVAGHLFPSATHAGEPARGIGFLRELVAVSRAPVIAIGGILPGHCRLLHEAGASGVAVIRGIWDAPNAERAAADYLSCYDDVGAA